MLVLALGVLMGIHLWGTLAHEIAGSLMLVLLVVHNVLNRQWYSTLSKGRYGSMRIVLSVLVGLVLLLALILAYSGETISRYIFAALPSLGSPALAHRLHLWAAYWGMLLMCLHIGLHWTKFIRLGDISNMLVGGRWLGILAKLLKKVGRRQI